MRLIDSHCHPQLEQYAEDRDAVMRRSLDAGIGMICIGTSVADSFEAITLAERYPNDPVFAVIGVHPNDDDAASVHPEQLASLMGSNKVVGVGETGLDYFRVVDPEALKLQADLFEQHIIFAMQRDLPLVVHVRDNPNLFGAYGEALKILTRHQAKKFVMHCYGGDWAHAEQFLALGGMVSFTGILTFPKSEMMQEVAKKAPSGRIMVETDAPFLAPVPHRGKRNEPAWVKEVVKALADVRGESVDKISQQTTANALRFFNLPS